MRSSRLSNYRNIVPSLELSRAFLSCEMTAVHTFFVGRPNTCPKRHHCQLEIALLCARDRLRYFEARTKRPDMLSMSHATASEKTNDPKMRQIDSKRTVLAKESKNLAPAKNSTTQYA